jgi:hypothetical protein
VARLRVPDKISRKQSEEKIAAYARLGSHHYQPRPTNGPEVIALLKSLRLDPSRMIEECRNYRNPVPGLENMVGSRWKTAGQVSSIDPATGAVLQEVKGYGEISLSPYLSHLEDACEARDEAIARTSFTAMRQMAMHGVASIEAFLGLAALRWNATHPDAQLIDSKQHKVALEDKFDLWMPRLSGGAPVRKDDQVWSDFLHIQRLRDSMAHPKPDSVGGNFAELAKALNAFRHGIAMNLGRLHGMLGATLPAAVINAYYFPDVEVVDDAP